VERKTVMFNEKRAVKVFEILNDFWLNEKGMFKDVILPQDLWIPDGWERLSPQEQANFFLFAALPMRGGRVSEDPFKWLQKLWIMFPEFFDVKIIAEILTPEYMKEAIKATTNEILDGPGIGQLGGGSLSYKMEEHIPNWITNATALYRHWNGNLLNVFAGVSEFEEPFGKIDYKKYKKRDPRREKCFYGVRRKIISLLTIFLQEKNLIPIFPTPIPVDFHAQRILWQTDIINPNNWVKLFTPTKEKHPKELAGKLSVHVWERFTDQIAIWSQSFLQKIGISHMVINPALWVLSRTLCAEHLQTSSRDKGQTFYTAEKLEKNPHLWSKNRKNPCEFCPIEKFCGWCIPANPYYSDGYLIRIERIPHSSSRLSGIDWVNLGPTYKVRKNKNRGAIKS
jgi:hypothetical protein